MTDTVKPSFFTKAALADNARALNAARADVALLERLKAAAGEITRLMKEGDQLTAALDKNLADEAKEEKAAQRQAEKAEREEIAAHVRNLRITVEYPNANGKRDVVGALITLHCEVQVWDSNLHRSDWQAAEFPNLRYVTDKVAKALMQDAGKLLPSIILDLAPGDPIEALRLYYLAKSRGYVAG